jgi:hypothetical protein
LIIGVIDTAPNGTYDPIDIYVIDKTKTATLAKLKTIYPNAVIKTTSAPVTVDSLTGFVVVVGPAAAPTPTK